MTFRHKQTRRLCFAVKNSYISARVTKQVLWQCFTVCCRVSKADRLRSENPVDSVQHRGEHGRRRHDLVLVIHYHLRQQR